MPYCNKGGNEGLIKIFTKPRKPLGPSHIREKQYFHPRKNTQFIHKKEQQPMRKKRFSMKVRYKEEQT